MGDREIILLLKRMPSDGLYQLMQKYQALVYTVCGRILPGHLQDVEECVEDTFVNIWQYVDKIDPDTPTFKGLILSTARNVAITRYRKLRRAQIVSLDTLDLAGNEDIADTVLGAEATREVQQLILNMDEPDRGIFFRKYFLFESYKEIGEKMGLDEGQVRNRLYRGRLRLRQQMEDRGISYEAI